MKTKKTLTMIMAVALACVLSVAGTLAYLTATTDTVTNTFAAQGLIDAENFDLKEHKAVADATNPGTYTLNDEEVTSNDYDVVPGIDLPKDPFVRVKALKANAYLFIEVVDTTPNTLTATIDSAWQDTGVTGKHGGEVYTLASGALTAAADMNMTQNILAGDKVVVDANYVGADGQNLVFYGYLAQAAGFENAAAAWTATFGA